jgi:DNA-binding XRE family transcriptional regulator
MRREEFITICDQKLKLTRTEYGLTQEKMAWALGISKKTLIEIEKERRSLGWTTSVTFCTIFDGSEILMSAFGSDPAELASALAFDGTEPLRPQTSGGRIWWTTIRENDDYLIQQNIVSQHYRLLTRDYRRVMSSFRLDDILPVFNRKRSA